MIRNFVKNRKNWTGIMICFCIIMANAGYAAESLTGNAVYRDKKMEITYPEKNSTVSGYFLPVSWRDPAVENKKMTYPENYQQSGKTYQITVSDKLQNIMLKASVSDQNYFIFNYDDIKGLLPSDYYSVTVENEDNSVSTASVRFFYQEPADDTDINNQAATDNQTAVSESPGTETLALTSVSCPYCLTDNWPGMLVYFFNQTAYSKKVTIDCNEDNWSSLTFAPSFSGPFFISMSSGNFKVTYNDSVSYSVKCINIYPWAYTIVPLP